MRSWLFFNRDLIPGEPGVHEVMRFKEAANALDIDLQVLKPSEFDLVVDAKNGWSPPPNCQSPRPSLANSRPT